MKYGGRRGEGHAWQGGEGEEEEGEEGGSANVLWITSPPAPWTAADLPDCLGGWLWW